jgi:sulfide:quinone oxidoreductase
MNSGFLSEMKITQLSLRFFVSAQITVEDLSIFAAQGFRSIINNRPDNEIAGQPRSADLATAAASLGIEFLHIPVIPGALTYKDVDDFERACTSLEGPILLFCRSGARSTNLWKLSAIQ